MFQDPFDELDNSKENNVHIRIQMRKGKKAIVSVQNLADDLDLKKITKHFKKEFNCNAHIKEDAEYGEIILVQGDHREQIRNFLINEEIIDKSKIVMHGF